jgi:hypothetical protein
MVEALPCPAFRDGVTEGVFGNFPVEVMNADG